MQALYSQLQSVVQKVITLLPPSYDYNETHYQKVLAHELSKSKAFSSFEISQEAVIPYQLEDGFTFGHGRADLILLNHLEKSCIIIELKANVSVRFPQLKKYRAQLSKYVKHFRTHCHKRGVVVVFNPTFCKENYKIDTIGI